MMFGNIDYLVYNYSIIIRVITQLPQMSNIFKITYKTLMKMKKIKECLKKAAKWYVTNCVFEKGNAYQIY